VSEGASTQIVDCDVHPLMTGGVDALFPYLTESWQRRLATRETVTLSSLPPGRYPHPAGTGFLRRESVPPDGGPPGSDPDFMRADLLDANGVDCAVLLPIQATATSWWTDPDEAAALVSAYNAYFAEHWLATDPRFRLAMVIAPQDPELAAKEIRAFGPTEGVVCVWLPVLNIPIGNRFYRPIFEAAQELDLTVMLHPIGSDGNFQGTPTFAGGVARSYSERYCLLSEIAQTNLSSAIFEGLFETFPRLKVVFAEYGWTWLPSMLWRMDAVWQGLRVEVPWVRRPPSEYVLDHVRFTSEPAAEIPSKRYAEQVLEMAHAERVLLFSSDYPHWDSEEPDVVFRHLDPELRTRIFFANAIESYPRLSLTASDVR
jgi:predicted TIM-barrel fold metal-dependent hydrolase